MDWNGGAKKHWQDSGVNIGRFQGVNDCCLFIRLWD